MTLFDNMNPATQLLASALVGLLIGSLGVSVLAYNNLLPGLTVQTDGLNDVNDKLDELLNMTRETGDRLLSNTRDLPGFIKDAGGSHDSIGRDVKEIIDMLNKNGINMSTTLPNLLFNKLDQILNAINSLNVTNVTKNINNVNNFIRNINNVVNNVNSKTNNIFNLSININQTTVNINNLLILISQQVDLIYTQTTDIYVFITEQMYTVITNIYDIVVVINNVLGDVYNIVISIQQQVNNIIDMLVVIDYKTQKEVIIQPEYISETPDPLTRQFYVVVSLEGEGGLESTSLTRIFVLGVPDATVVVLETGEPGIFIVTVTLPEGVSSGTYLVVFESEIVLTLPDGSTEVFVGRKAVTIYVW